MREIIFIILVIFTLQTSCEVETELQLVQILFRHGDRTCVRSYPNDPYKESFWHKYGGYGQLTQTGMNQHYQFGKYLRKFYDGFLNKYYLREDLNVISTPVDRTIMSANSLLSGLYEPKDYQLWNNKVNWQPIPVHPQDHQNDKIFYSDHIKCPRIDQLRKEIPQTNEFIERNNRYKHLFDVVNNNSGCADHPKRNCDNTNLLDEWRIGDCLFVEKTHGLKLPDWVGPIYDRLRYSHGWGFYFMYKNIESARLRAGGILGDMRKNIFAKIYQNDTKQLRLYSAHDMNIAALTKLLNFTNHINQPSYASAVGLELRKEKTNNNYYVKVFYKNNTASEDINYRNVKMFGCDNLCPIEKFTKLTQDLIINDFPSECESKSEVKIIRNVIYDSLKGNKSHKFILNIGVAILVLSLITAVLIIVAIFRKKTTNREYSHFDSSSIQE